MSRTKKKGKHLDMSTGQGGPVLGIMDQNLVGILKS